MKKLIYILLIIGISGYSQSKKTPDFPENTTPVSSDLLLLWDYGTSAQQHIALGNLLYNGMVYGLFLNSSVAGDGLGQDVSGPLYVKTDGTTITIVGDELTVLSTGSLAGQDNYIFSTSDDLDTMILSIDDTYATFNHTTGDQILFTQGGVEAGALSDAFQTFNYNGAVKFWTSQYGVRIDTAIFFNGTTSGIYSSGTTMYFKDAVAGTKSLSQLLAGIDLSGSATNGIFYESSGALGSSSSFTYDATNRRFKTGANGNISGTYTSILGGNSNTVSQNYGVVVGGLGNTASNYYSTVLNGFSSTASGYYSTAAGEGVKAHDYGEFAVGLYNVPSTGNSSSMVGTNHVFTVGVGLSVGQEENAFEVFQNGLVYVKDSARASVVKVEDSLFLQDTWFTSDDLTEITHVSGTPVAGQIPIFTNATTIEGDDSLTWKNGGIIDSGKLIVVDTLRANGITNLNGILFTGSTKTAGAEYTGTTNPTNTNRKNYDGVFVPYNIWAVASSVSLGNGVLQGTYTGASGGYSGVRGVTNNGGYGVIATATNSGSSLQAIQEGIPTGHISSNLIDISRIFNANFNYTGNIINITDNPTTSGTISGKVLSATIGATERISMNPRVSPTGSSISYMFDTHNTLSGLDELLTIRNNGNDRFVIGAGGYGYFNNSVSIYANSFESTTDYGQYAAKSITLRSNNVNYTQITPSIVGGTRYLLGSENPLAGEKHTVWMRQGDTLAYLDSNQFKMNADSSIFTGYIKADSLVALSQVYADYVFEYDYRLPTFEQELKYAKANKTLEPLKDKTGNIGRRLENLVESHERLYLQVEQELKKRDEEISLLKGEIELLKMMLIKEGITQ